MAGDGVSDISTRAGEGVGGVVNGAGLTSESIARSGASGGGSTVGTETGVDTTPVSISVNPPHSTLASAALKNFASVSCILLLRKASVFGPKYSFSFHFHLYMS